MAADSLAILIDLDGTLVDSIPLLLASFRHAFATNGVVAPSDEAWTAGIGTPLAKQFQSFVADDAIRARLIESYREFQHAHHDHLLREYDGIRGAIETLHRGGRPVVVVTSKGQELACRALDFAALRPFVDHVVGVEATARHKPDPEPVVHALALVDRDPSDAVFIGDSPHDVASGRAAGVTTIAVTWGAFTREVLAASGPTYIIEHPRELVPLVSRVEQRAAERAANAR